LQNRSAKKKKRKVSSPTEPAKEEVIKELAYEDPPNKATTKVFQQKHVGAGKKAAKPKPRAKRTVVAPAPSTRALRKSAASTS
jgi:hypothetical protein